MTEFIQMPELPDVPVRLRRHARARRLTLRVSQVDGAVTLTLPPAADMAAARRFLADRAAWIAGVRAALPGPVPVVAGAMLPLRGVRLRVAPGTGRRVTAQDGALLAPGPPGRTAARLRAFLIAEARADALAAAARHAGALGLSPPPVRLADPGARWGSCSADGRLMLSWRLVMAPPFVLDYVAAHEAAHLAHMDHSRAFWATVARLFPDHGAARAWLKAEGAGLHRYDFTAGRVSPPARPAAPTAGPWPRPGRG
jgi:predicted metal-dependent hydrolase